MNWILTLAISTGVFFVTTAMLAIAVRGALRQQGIYTQTYSRRDLTGREIETLRRAIVNFGLTSVGEQDMINLIYTIRSIMLGNYDDDDPFVWADSDPYDGVEEERPEA